MVESEVFTTEASLQKKNKCAEKEVNKRKNRYLYGYIALIILIPIILGYSIYLIRTNETVTLLTGQLWIFLVLVLLVLAMMVYDNYVNVNCEKEEQQQPPTSI